jgi:shikimate kinase
LLAAKLQRPFIDLDQLIETQADCTIFDLVRERGEAVFRRLEADTLLRVAQAAPAVIAPGGGAITSAENRAVMKRYGVRLWLDAPFELCWSRIVADGVTRPLAPDEAMARARYEQRLPLYQASDIRVTIAAADSAADITQRASAHLAV